MTQAPLVRLYRPSKRRPPCAHWAPLTTASDELTLCGRSTHGMHGRDPREHAVAASLRICTACLAVAHGAPPLHGHPPMVGG
jgi:hypothetical protein